MKTITMLSAILLAVFTSTTLTSQNEVINYKELQSYLPKSLDGYSADEPGGQTTNMQGITFSSADINFTNNSGGFVRITLLDYTAAADMYLAATAMWNAGMSFEDDETTAESIQWSEDIAGWQEFRKKDKEAKLALGIGQRFFLSIEANNQVGLDFVKDIAKNINLEKLVAK